MYYNYSFNVSKLCQEWTMLKKRFSSIDVTKELQARCNNSFLKTKIYHSIVNLEIENFMRNCKNYVRGFPQNKQDS